MSTSGGTSDARFMSEICPVLEFGSVGETMHKTNEMVHTKTIEKLSEIYFEFLKICLKISILFFLNIDHGLVP